MSKDFLNGVNMHCSSVLIYTQDCVFNAFLKWVSDVITALSGLLVRHWKTLQEASLAPRQGGVVVTIRQKSQKNPAC